MISENEPEHPVAASGISLCRPEPVIAPAASIPARNLWSQSDLPAICVPAISLVAGVRFAPHISYVRVLGPVHWGTGLLLFKS